MGRTANAGQGEFWNGDIGRRWLAREAELEVANRAVTDFILTQVAAVAPRRVLEVGCGSGGLSLALAASLPQGAVLGADISAVLIERAQARGGDRANLSFALADVQTAELPGPFDMVVSCFGMMFFADPTAAFANIVRAMAAGGQILFVTFGPPSGNPWFGIPRQIAAAHLGEPPETPAGAPGPLAFADGERVVALMRAAGWHGATCDARPFDFHHPGGAAAAADLATALGPAAFILRTAAAPEAARLAVRDEIARAFAPFQGADGLRLPVVLNIFRAHCP